MAALPPGQEGDLRPEQVQQLLEHYRSRRGKFTRRTREQRPVLWDARESRALHERQLGVAPFDPRAIEALDLSAGPDVAARRAARRTSDGDGRQATRDKWQVKGYVDARLARVCGFRKSRELRPVNYLKPATLKAGCISAPQLTVTLAPIDCVAVPAPRVARAAATTGSLISSSSCDRRGGGGCDPLGLGRARAGRRGADTAAQWLSAEVATAALCAVVR